MKLSLSQLELLKHINENPTITQDELSKRTGKSVRTIKREMADMKEKGYICRLNGRRNGKWEVLIKI